MAATDEDADDAVTRRAMLGGGIATALSAAFPAPALARRRRPGDRINLAVIGAGGMGASNMAKLTGENIVAVADVDFAHVARAFVTAQGAAIPDRVALRDAYDKAARFADYRRMLDARRDIDAVVIATPDHHHAVAARLAMERGLHVYVQKPLAPTVAEARMLRDLARAKPKLVTQMGNQGHSGDDGRRVIELIRGGAIGRVREVQLWTNRPVWPQGIARPPAETPPPSLDWNLWLGPATVDWGYNPAYAHFNWRGWLPFGVGAIGDMGAHLMDFPVWALETGLPTRIETRHSPWGGMPARIDGGGAAIEHASFPLATITTYDFANAKGGALRMTWYDGGLMPPTPPGLPPAVRMNPIGGVLYLGDAGMLLHETYGEKPVLVGDGTAERAAAIAPSLPRVRGGRDGHEMNWVRAIRGEEAISCPFEVAAPLTEAMVLGPVALQAGQAIDYDGAAARITNVADANRFLARDHREGWTI